MEHGTSTEAAGVSSPGRPDQPGEEVRPAWPGLTPGELKQHILRIYNATNQQVWGAGVRQQRVDLLHEQIVIVAVHQRVPALAALDQHRRDLTRQVDTALVDHYKSVFQAALESELGLRVATVLKDYDPQTQFSGTVVVLAEPLSLPLR
jgi:uncharacterized protein YbcI